MKTTLIYASGYVLVIALMACVNFGQLETRHFWAVNLLGIVPYALGVYLIERKPRKKDRIMGQIKGFYKKQIWAFRTPFRIRCEAARSLFTLGKIKQGE